MSGRGRPKGENQEMAAEEGLGPMGLVLQMREGNPESQGQPPADGNVKQMDFPLEQHRYPMSVSHLPYERMSLFLICGLPNNHCAHTAL